MKSLLAAASFLTRLPIGRWTTFDATDVARSAAWFPVMGAILGAILALAGMLLKQGLPLGVTAVLLVLLDALLTGALHWDGLADCADGFGGGKDRADILRIMRDHAIGAYGGIALAIFVALRATAYAYLLDRGSWKVAAIVSPMLGRWSILMLGANLPYARSTTSVADHLTRRSLYWGTAVTGAILLASPSLEVAAATGVAALVTLGFGLYCRSRIGGITGDTLGANVVLVESAALLVFLWAR